MRKLFSILLALILSFIPVISLAAQVPLVAKGKSVYVPDESNIELVSYNLFFRVRTGFSSANTSMVIKNQDPDEPITFKMGIPEYLDSVSKIRDLSVESDGKSIKVLRRSTLKNPPSDKQIDVKNWYVWDVSIDPGETKVIECSFSFDNKLELDGTETISFPLNLLENWQGSIKNVRIIADLDFYPPYAFDPMPSIVPIRYDNHGRLTFEFKDVQSFPSNLDLSFKPMDVIITRYIESKSESNNDIKAILDSYKNKSYHKTIDLIHELLSTSDDIELLPELKYMEALCYQSLYDLDKALNLFNQLEPNPGFGETLSGTIKNKIIYDKTEIIKTQPDGDEKAVEYLNSIKDSVAKDNIFSMWMEEEITLLTPPVIEEEPSADDNQSMEQEEDKDQSADKTPKVIDKITIGKYEFYIEEIIVAALIFLVLIFIITRIIKRKRRRRSSIFRY